MKWVNTELPKTMADKFKGYLREHNITYEASECFNLIHFECFMNETQIIKANAFIDKIN